MKNTIVFLTFFLFYFSGFSQQATDIKIKLTAPVLEASVAAQIEHKLGTYFSVVAGLGYNDTEVFHSLASYLPDIDFEDSGFIGELGLRYYSRPFFGMDQGFLLGKLKYQGPSDYNTQGSSVGASFGIGSKFVFYNKLLLETYIGFTALTTNTDDFFNDNAGVRSSAPLLLWGVNMGYRIQGETTKGTPAYYGAKSRKKKKSSKSKKKKKKKKRKKRRN